MSGFEVWLGLVAATSPEANWAALGQWLVALGAAFVGAVLALSGEIAIRQVTLRNHFSNLKQLLIEEVKFIRHEAGVRSVPGPGLPLRAPLPTSAWDLLRTSGEAHRLGAWLNPTLDFYRRVAEVNWSAGAVLSLQQISSLSDKEDVASQFYQEAARLASEPYQPLIGLADALLASLGARMDADPPTGP